MNEVSQWIVLIALAIVVLEMWIRLHSFLCHYEEESEEIRIRLENLQRKGEYGKESTEMIAWNYKPIDGWTNETRPESYRPIVWKETSGQIMAGYFDPSSSLFKNHYLIHEMCALPHVVSAWGYIE